MLVGKADMSVGWLKMTVAITFPFWARLIAQQAVAVRAAHRPSPAFVQTTKELGLPVGGSVRERARLHPGQSPGRLRQQACRPRGGSAEPSGLSCGTRPSERCVGRVPPAALQRMIARARAAFKPNLESTNISRFCTCSKRCLAEGRSGGRRAAGPFSGSRSRRAPCRGRPNRTSPCTSG
jgi:hypothetical protein